MAHRNTTALVPDQSAGEPHKNGSQSQPPQGQSAAVKRHARGEGVAGDRRYHRQRQGFLTQYKAEQGKATRRGTFIGAGLLIAWGSWFLYDQLRIYEGDESWRLLISPGLPMLFAVVIGVIAWRLTFVNRKSSDFMIATEGEMKKVSWSTKGEVIGSTKVVIVFTLLLALLLFGVDLLFQRLFSWIGVLKT